MRLPISWLKEYVDFDDTPQGLADEADVFRHRGRGHRDHRRRPTRASWSAKCSRSTSTPTRTSSRSAASTPAPAKCTVVCGAPNARPGIKVPFARVGVTLPNGMTLKPAKIRGVESDGMLCAEDELGISEDHSGLMVLDPKWAPGTPLSEVLGPPETVLELEVTPNRPDCLSVIGIAREVAALYGDSASSGRTFMQPSPTRRWNNLTSVDVEDDEGCPRYTARVMSGVRIGPSPAWMKRRLELSGIRAINNVVDITNYVMLECGQPLHAFDQALLAEGHHRCAGASRGREDGDAGRHRAPADAGMLVIADAHAPVAVAGVMGGAGSEIRDDTQTVLLESACFKPQDIRATSKKLGLVTESSYRFERGVDIGRVEWASRRAAALMVDMAGATVARGVIDVYPKPPDERCDFCRFDRVRSLLGLEATNEQIRRIFESWNSR